MIQMPVLSDKEADAILEKGLYFDHNPSNGEVHRTIQRDQTAKDTLRWFLELVVSERKGLKLALAEYKALKPTDHQGLVVYRAKLNILQMIVTKLKQAELEEK